MLKGSLWQVGSEADGNCYRDGERLHYNRPLVEKQQEVFFVVGCTTVSIGAECGDGNLVCMLETDVGLFLQFALLKTQLVA